MADSRCDINLTPSSYKFNYICTVKIPQFTTIHMHAVSLMSCIQCYTITSNEVTVDTTAMVQITYMFGYVNIPEISSNIIAKMRIMIYNFYLLTVQENGCAKWSAYVETH